MKKEKNFKEKEYDELEELEQEEIQRELAQYNDKLCRIEDEDCEACQ